MKNNYFKNRKMLRRCERIYKLIFRGYFISCVPLSLITLIYGSMALATVSSDIFRFTTTMILSLALFGTGLLSVYKKEKKFTYLPLLFAIILSLVNSFDDMLFLNVLTMYYIDNIPVFITVISSVLLTFTHKKYHYLEQQDGFPYFNERFEENKNSLSDYNNNNPYQQTMERYKKASSGEMDDI
ncbi:MAG: hypothetical protein K2I80_01775 [Ruminococcus sp.]|nr:hypothetical protein [Ruminococcus sp.]MDE6848612.1 hypothetical protein [Ruminococcus sp.]